MDASTNLDLTADPSLIEDRAPQTPKTGAPEQVFDWDKLRNSEGFVPGLAVLIGMLLAFWPFVSRLPGIWFGDDGYLSHGILVPCISAYVVFRWWPKIGKRDVRPTYLAIVPLIALLWVTRAAIVNQVDQLTSLCLIFGILFSVAFVAGWRWMLAVTLPTLYLAFAMPIWNMAITYYTNPLQTLSTHVAIKMLDITGFHPYAQGDTVYLDNFPLLVGVPCSGLKLVLALYAFTIFFAMIARLRWWANVILIGVIPLPLALFINGLRIMMIGIVGNDYGADAGHKFHDWSGYLALVICFLILFRFARWLGWKD